MSDPSSDSRLTIRSSADRYGYDRRDPRQDRTLYMYAPYRGSPFLTDYTEARERALGRLGRAMTSSAAPHEIVTREVGSQALDADLPLPRAEPIQTFVILSACVRHGGITEAAGGEVKEAWLDIFSRKFEVAHRLRATYGADLRPLGDDETQLESYALLAYLLAGSDPGTDLRRLNALLKLNDLLVAIHGQHRESILTIACAIASLKEELAAIERLAALQGVDLEKGSLSERA